MGFDQINTIGIFQPNSSAVGHKVVVRFKAHATTFSGRAVGHAPKMPLFKLSFFGSLV
jgi:hypothetical protein